MTNPYRYAGGVWLDCTHPGCDSGVNADWRHVPNLTASGGWECHRHEDGADQ